MWAYNLTMRLGYVPIVYDDKFFDCHTFCSMKFNYDFAVVSPGFSRKHPLIKFLQRENIELISEIELAYLARENKGTIVGVTGTNGKTTVVSMLKSILGARCMLAGNIGVPWSKVIDENKEITVLELSSYQLDFIKTFTPSIAVITNLAPDHIDHHGNYESYKKAKLNLIKNITNITPVVYCGEDSELRLVVEKQNVLNAYYFAESKMPGFGAYIDGNWVVIENAFGVHRVVKLENDVTHHNKLNILASVMVAFLLGTDKRDVEYGLKNFRYPKFRQEFVPNTLGLTIINDSKATNLASTLALIINYKKIETLIVGGRGKDEDYSKLFECEVEINRIVAYGESGQLFVDCSHRFGYKNITNIFDFDDAVGFALKNTKTGELILSPACSSLDQFESFNARGERFNKLVKDYENKSY